MRKILIALSLIFLANCSEVPKALEKPTVASHFADLKGCFLLYNVKTQSFDQVYGDETCKERFPACSSFKVPLAVMAFDAGILKDENTILKWDGKKDDREVVNKDHSAKTWMQDSVVWYSQRITPQLGQKKFKKYLKDFNYGNQDLGGGITKAWLVAPDSKGSALKISAYEQVDFMKALWTDKLPASPKAQQLTREITYLETSPKGFKLSGKTGSNFYNNDRKMRFGWFIAHLQKDDQEYIAVTNISDVHPTTENGYGGLKSKDITKKILNDQGLW